MATITRRSDVGVDIRGWSAPWQIAGITVNNPTGSWINIPNVGAVPPYTMGWARGISPAMLSIEVLFVASPSGTPSVMIGNPITVTIDSESVADDAGANTGAAEIQTAGRGDVQYHFVSGSVVEAGTHINDLIFGVDVQLALVGMSAWADLNGLNEIRGPVRVFAFQGPGVQLFPTIVITPETPQSEVMRPIPLIQPLIGAGVAVVEFWGSNSDGCGATGVGIYLEYYLIEQN